MSCGKLFAARCATGSCSNRSPFLHSYVQCSPSNEMKDAYPELEECVDSRLRGDRSRTEEISSGDATIGLEEFEKSL